MSKVEIIVLDPAIIASLAKAAEAYAADPSDPVAAVDAARQVRRRQWIARRRLQGQQCNVRGGGDPTQP